MGWEHYQTADPLKREPQVGWGLFGVRLLTFQISIFQIHQIFNMSYFPQFNLHFKKKTSPEMPKNHPKIYTNP